MPESEFLDLVEHDWAQLRTGMILHAVAQSEGDDGMIPVGGPGTTVCGVKGRLGIPGIFSRMGAPRCKRCCRALGWPQGKGSPKNSDDALRALAEARIAMWDGWEPTPEMAALYAERELAAVVEAIPLEAVAGGQRAVGDVRCTPQCRCARLRA